MLFISFWTAAEEGITYGLEKTEGAMKIGETRWTGNIGYTRHKTKIYKTKNTTQRTDERHGPPPKTGGDSQAPANDKQFQWLLADNNTDGFGETIRYLHITNIANPSGAPEFTTGFY